MDDAAAFRFGAEVAPLEEDEEAVKEPAGVATNTASRSTPWAANFSRHRVRNNDNYHWQQRTQNERTQSGAWEGQSAEEGGQQKAKAKEAGD